jgi:hypothetical protein
VAEWTPVTEVIRDACTFERNRLGEPRAMSVEAFDRWLAEVRAKAWDEGYAQGDRALGRDPVLYKVNPYLDQVRLREEADRG